MTLDDKLKGWREATETLAPSDAPLAKLAAVAELAPAAAPAASASASGIAVKVIVLAVALGVTTWAWLVLPRVELQGMLRSRLAQTQPTRALVDAGLTAAAAPAELACPPQPTEGALAEPAAVMRPGMADDRYRAERLRGLRKALSGRPTTCEAQQTPIISLIAEGQPSVEETRRLVARLVFLCGSRSTPMWALPAARYEGCDNSDWCHAPKCDLLSEDCATQFAARPTASCNAVTGRHMLANIACERFLRGAVSRAQVEKLEADAWCLHEAAIAEGELFRRTAKGDAP